MRAQEGGRERETIFALFSKMGREVMVMTFPVCKVFMLPGGKRTSFKTKPVNEPIFQTLV